VIRAFEISVSLVVKILSWENFNLRDCWFTLCIFIDVDLSY